MDKLLVFLREHETSPAIIVRDLKHAAEQLPKSGQLEEGAKLQEAALKGDIVLYLISRMSPGTWSD